MFEKRKKRNAVRRAMDEALTYEAWREAAEELDRIDERFQWVEDERSSCYDAAQVRRAKNELRAARLNHEPVKLAESLVQAIDQLGAQITALRLYCETYTGESKRLPRELLRETVLALSYLESEPMEGYPDSVKLGLFKQNAHRFGRSALMLSGGATMGIYHLGIVKALFDAGLLPTVVCGSSMGAIVAAGVCTRSDEELAQFFAEPERIHREALMGKGLLTMAKERSLFDPKQLLTHVQSNIVGDMTFADAFKKTGRLLNISVSPVHQRQKPRILNHVSTPDLLVSHSAVASCAMPFLYPPAMLMARDSAGKAVPYLPDERWLDGSVAGDLPMARVGRLHNVNHFIVSQTNPHVYLMVSRSETPRLPYIAFEAAGSIVRAQAGSVLGSVRKYLHDDHLRPILDQVYSLTAQPYLGDINLHPRVDPGMLRKFLSNPTKEDIDSFILEGQRVTWPKLPMIRDQTLISRTFAEVIARVEARVAGKPAAPRVDLS